MLERCLWELHEAAKLLAERHGPNIVDGCLLCRRIAAINSVLSDAGYSEWMVNMPGHETNELCCVA